MDGSIKTDYLFEDTTVIIYSTKFLFVLQKDKNPTIAMMCTYTFFIHLINVSIKFSTISTFCNYTINSLKLETGLYAL